MNTNEFNELIRTVDYISSEIEDCAEVLSDIENTLRKNLSSIAISLEGILALMTKRRG